MANPSGVFDVPGRHFIESFIPGQATAGTTNEWVCFKAPCACKVRSIDWTPSAAVTGDNTDNFILDIQNKNNSTGLGSTSLMSSAKTYATGTNSVAFVSEAFTLSATEASITLAAGDVITMKRTKTGNGLAQPQGTVRFGFDPK